MNLAIWKKAVSDAWRQLFASCIVLLVFSWIFVWLMSRFPMGKWGMLLSLLPSFVQPMLGVPLAKLATPLGQLSILYVHVITLLVCAGWALGRGSDSISGEIGRGTMDLILSLPVWRFTVMAAPAVVTALGTAVLAASVWLGTLLGLRCVSFEQHVSPNEFLPGAVNLFAMVFCFTGITTMISSGSRDRWRTMGWAGGFFVISTMIKIITRMWPEGQWLNWCTFLTLFQPQDLILTPEGGLAVALKYDLALLVLGLACYAIAAVIFWYRDIPAPR
jgi:ABC-2 type transport system permease protein